MPDPGFDDLEYTLPYGAIRQATRQAAAHQLAADLAAQLVEHDSFSSIYSTAVNPGLNPGGAPAVRTRGRRRARSTALSLASGPPLPEGIDMPRTPERAPRHAPDVRIGCDVHPVSQTAASIALFGDRYLHRVFTDRELDQCAGDVNRLTGRFAAKEAVLKVLQPSSADAVPWPSIEVRAGANGAPFVSLSGAASVLADRQGIERIDISVSHDAGVGMAVAAAIRTMEVAS